MVSFYGNWLLPRLSDLSMRQQNLVAYRQRVIRSAEGNVLEIGVGSGVNLPFYTDRVDRVIALDPSAELLRMARGLTARTERPVELMEASAEAIPLPDRHVDTVVTTWTLCTIPDAVRALTEVRRVLKPEGKLLFAEHGLSPDAGVRGWQDRLTPVWKCVGGACHLNRPIDELIKASGFRSSGCRRAT